MKKREWVRTDALECVEAHGQLYIKGLTEREMELLKVLREKKLDFGKVMCIIYYQDGLVTRIEIEKVVESVKIG